MLRIPNLLIVFLTQWVPYWWVLRPAILKAGGIPVVTPELFGLISGATVLTTMGGYIINDYYDYRSDIINKPNRVVVGRYLPAQFVLFVYLGVVAGIFFMAVLIDRQLPEPHSHWPLWVFPVVSFALFLYAWQLKCTPVVGNLLVSIMCGVVPVIVLIPEERPVWLSSYYHPEYMHQTVALVWLYALFAFITNLLREQVKDLEDFEGDAACGCTTLAVMRGPRYAKKPAGFTGITVSILIVFLLYFWSQTEAPTWQLVSGVLLLLLPALAATVMVYSARRKQHFTIASLFVKIIMAAGIFLLIREWPNSVTHFIGDYVSKSI